MMLPSWEFLSVCSRCGKVKEGLELFETIKCKYQVEHGIEHYSCLVDLLLASMYAYKGRWRDAEVLRKKIKARSVIKLLAGCSWIEVDTISESNLV